MSADQQPDIVEREVRIAARPEVVFLYFTDPARIVQWKGISAFLDARVGGVYRVNVTGRDIALGEYLEIEPYSRIVISWGWESGPVPPGSTRVEITFIPDGDGTIVRLRHSGLGGEAAAQHAEGWEHYLARLVLAAEGTDAGPDPWVTPQASGMP